MGGEIGCRSESKVILGEKRSSAQFGGKLERCKRMKVRDLDSVCRSEEMIESNRRFLSVDKEKPQEPLLEIAEPEKTNKMLPSVVKHGIKTFDLNSEIPVLENSATINHDATLDNSKGFGWDLSAENNFNSPKENKISNFKNYEIIKSGDVSECGSTTGPFENKDPMRVWKEMKQNGFLSSSHMSLNITKQRGRKSKNDGFKKKMEIAKKEQIDRFAKIAAPSGLLNDLNPGIINHVRNRKQVHSIIEALVKLEKKENHQGVGKEVVDDHRGELVNMDQLERDGNSKKVEREFFDRSYLPLLKKEEREDSVLALKLSLPTNKAHEEISSLSCEEPSNLGSVSSLSVKAAGVAFQWLELIQHDIKGRLAALKRSKKRVQSVITTELPFLMSREFSDSQENDPYFAKNLVNENANAHRAKWNGLFGQMEKTLSEEEKQMEIWLHQVVEMQRQCEKGLHLFRYHPVNVSQRPGTYETDQRLEEGNKFERELAVRAAAASIYSTCNYLSSENLPCY